KASHLVATSGPGAGHGVGLALRDTAAIAPVGHGEEAATGHHEAAEPDPVHEGLDMRADRPDAAAQRLAHREVDVAQQAAVDRGFRHGLAALAVHARL